LILNPNANYSNDGLYRTILNSIGFGKLLINGFQGST